MQVYQCRHCGGQHFIFKALAEAETTGGQWPLSWDLGSRKSVVVSCFKCGEEDYAVRMLVPVAPLAESNGEVEWQETGIFSA